MIRKLTFLAFVKVDQMFSIDQRLGARGIDCWAVLLEKMGMTWWPDYDGERLRDLLFGGE